MKIWRRDPSGKWGKESTPGAAGGVLTRGGTVHYYRLGGGVADGSPTTNIFYGRRSGTTWSEQAAVSVVNANADFDFDVGLDLCGAPHFVYSSLDRSQDPLYLWPTTYARWTAAGWRTTHVYTSQNPPGAGIRLSSTSASATFFGGSPDIVTASMPLR